MTTKPRTKNPPAPVREPREAEKAAIKAAIDRVNARPAPLSVKAIGGKITAPHSDVAGWSNHLSDTVGTASDGFLTAAVRSLEQVSRHRGGDKMSDLLALDAALAVVGAVGPTNELEAALAIQMAGTHCLATELLGRAKQTDRTDHIQLYGGLAVKLQNAFANQLGALAKLRGGGKQQVEVRHVYINGNAVIGDVHATGGEAGAAFSNQPRAQGLAHLPGAPMPPMRSADPEGDALPVASGEGAEAMPDARRGERRRAEG